MGGKSAYAWCILPSFPTAFLLIVTVSRWSLKGATFGNASMSKGIGIGDTIWSSSDSCSELILFLDSRYKISNALAMHLISDQSETMHLIAREVGRALKHLELCNTFCNNAKGKEIVETVFTGKKCSLSYGTGPISIGFIQCGKRFSHTYPNPT